ncbi:MAG: hypothetical protein IJS32_04420 [Kiritimatiellae bacterium]|nr:hypothetical protein [Kiritimatiellia bacterium]
MREGICRYIENWLRRAKQAEQSGDASFSEDDFHAGLDAFFATNGASIASNLLPLIALYGGGEEHRANPLSEILKRRMLWRLGADMELEEVLDAVIPLMDSCTPATAFAMKTAMGGAASRDAAGTLWESTSLSEYLRKRKDTPPYPLIRFRYCHGGFDAFRLVASVYGDVRVAGDDTAEDLKAIADGGTWWEELYAAERARNWRDCFAKHGRPCPPQWCDGELLERLRRSKHAVVREAVDRIGLPPAPEAD